MWCCWKNTEIPFPWWICEVAAMKILGLWTQMLVEVAGRYHYSILPMLLMIGAKHKTGRKPLKLGTVENYHHHWYLLIWLVYLTLFAIAEHVVTDNYWVSYLPLDDKIPFCRYFIIPYCLWHPLLFLMTLYLMFYDAEGLKRYMLYIGLGFGGSILFCLIFPNGQDLRPTEFARL